MTKHEIVHSLANRNFKRTSYTLEQVDFIFKHQGEMTAKEFSQVLNLPAHTILSIKYRYCLQFKSAKGKDPEAPLRHKVPKSLLPDPKPEPIKRAKAIYSNSGYLSTLEKYDL
jgi:hypothetical protein